MKSPYMTMVEAAEYLRYSGDRPAEKAINFLRRSGAKLQRRGRTYLVKSEEIDRILNGEMSNLDEQAHRLATSDRSRRLRGTR